MTIWLGCPGQALNTLRHFKRAAGIDPSAKMLESARKYIDANDANGSWSKFPIARDPPTVFDFVNSPAEELTSLEQGSVDLVVSGEYLPSRAALYVALVVTNLTAAQAAHWFDWTKLWPQLARVVRPGGTVAFWVSIQPSISETEPNQN